MIEERGRVLAVDPGEKRIGLAVSDLTQSIANPLRVIKHVSRVLDAAQVAQAAVEQKVVLILIGQALDSEGEVGPQARKAERFADAVRAQTDIPVLLWDESGSTQDAQFVRRAMGGSRRSRQGHMDDVAAAVLLQSYLDAHNDGTLS